MRKSGNLISIIGPTASGKSEIALFLADKIAGEIVNIDSLTIYRYFDIGTAKPTLKERKLITHHLIDILEPEQKITVVDFVYLAEKEINKIIFRGKIPILVVGSPLYFYSLTKDSFNPPPTDKALRKQLSQRVEDEGLEVLFIELKNIDPLSSQKINPQDKKRIIRALEVCYLTGKPFSCFRKGIFDGFDRYTQHKVGLKPGRLYLKERIAKRTNKMIEQGLIEETRKIIKEGISITAPVFESIGYKEALCYIANKLSLEEVKNDINTRTYKYAKHQMTWFKRDRDIQWFEYNSDFEYEETKFRIIQYLEEKYE